MLVPRLTYQLMHELDTADRQMAVLISIQLYI